MSFVKWFKRDFFCGVLATLALSIGPAAFAQTGFQAPQYRRCNFQFSSKISLEEPLTLEASMDQLATWVQSIQGNTRRQKEGAQNPAYVSNTKTIRKLSNFLAVSPYKKQLLQSQVFRELLAKLAKIRIELNKPGSPYYQDLVKMHHIVDSNVIADLLVVAEPSEYYGKNPIFNREVSRNILHLMLSLIHI